MPTSVSIWLVLAVNEPFFDWVFPIHDVAHVIVVDLRGT